jgi:hypothetical protein
MKTILPLFFFLFSISILKAQTSEWLTYNSSNSGLPYNDIESIAIDGSGTKWIGTNSHGLIKFDGTNSTVYNTSNSGIGSNGILSIVIDGLGNKWFGTGGGGVEKFDGTQFTAYDGGDNVASVAIDGSGNIWAAGQVKGLLKFDGSNWTIYNTSNSGLHSNAISSVAIDGSGNKWVGETYVGLSKFDGTNWTVYTSTNSGLPAGVVFSIAIDGSGTKWLGTLGGGLVKFDDVNWTVYNSSNSSLPYHTNIRKVIIDGSGNKWIGTWGDGLLKFDGTTWSVYTTSNSGLPGNYVTSIVIDSSGNKWIGCEGGVAVFKEGGIAVPAAKILNGQFDNGTQDWQLTTYGTSGAAATIKVDTNSVISGHNSCAVTISKTTGTDYEIQMWQGLNIYPGHKYTFTFKAKASANRSVILALQKAVFPNTTYMYKSHNLTTQVQTFTDEVTITTTDQAKLQFYFGSSTASVWIDDITIVDTPLTTGIDEPLAAKGTVSVLQNYPNPFNTTTTIKYKVTEPGFISLKVFDMMGTEVTSLVNEQKAAGEYSVEWNAAGLESGIYFCQLQAGTLKDTKKLILQK